MKKLIYLLLLLSIILASCFFEKPDLVDINALIDMPIEETTAENICQEIMEHPQFESWPVYQLEFIYVYAEETGQFEEIGMNMLFDMQNYNKNYNPMSHPVGAIIYRFGENEAEASSLRSENPPTRYIYTFAKPDIDKIIDYLTHNCETVEAIIDDETLKNKVLSVSLENNGRYEWAVYILGEDMKKSYRVFSYASYYSYVEGCEKAYYFDYKDYLLYEKEW